MAVKTGTHKLGRQPLEGDEAAACLDGRGTGRSRPSTVTLT